MKSQRDPSSVTYLQMRRVASSALLQDMLDTPQTRQAVATHFSHNMETEREYYAPLSRVAALHIIQPALEQRLGKVCATL